MVRATERDFIDRVDDGILVNAHHLSRLRGQTIRAALEDVRESANENIDRSVGTDDYDIWALRIERCNVMLSNPDDLWLRRRTTEALENDR